MTHAEIEEFITRFPLYQYAFTTPRDLVFDDKTRLFCKQECSSYGSCWSCPPTVGKISQLRERCLEYTDVLFFSSVAEVSDITDQEDRKKTKATHVKMTQIIEDFMRENGYLVYSLTSGPCTVCAKCSFPKAKCRHPESMYPCIESHGISAADLAEDCCMDYYMGEKLLLRFTILFFRQ